MAYEVTATKKRPQTFDELIGQEFVVSTLKSSLEQSRVAHAYLFAGPRGVGKTSAARILAKALNCEEGTGPTPCGVCSNCKEITAGNSLDVIEIDGASNTSVNDVREIKDEVLFAPSNSRYKVYIIDEVHMLSNSAFNALLKTIEEPPPYIIFIFATTEVHKVPPTIRSRCQQFNFRLIPAEDMKAQLVTISKEAGIEAEGDALFWIAKEATGSLRDAYTLFDQIVSFSEDSITLDKITEKLGLIGFEKLNCLVELLVDGNSKQVLELTDEIIASGVSIEQFILDLTEYFRNLLFIRHDIKKESLLGVSEERFSRKNLDAYTVPQLEEAIRRLLKLYRDMRFSLNQRFELELTLSRLATLHEYIDQREILHKIRNLRSELVGKASTPGADTSEVEPSGLNASGEDTSAAATPSEESSASQDEKTPPEHPPAHELLEKLAEAFKRQMTLAANLKKAKQVSIRDNTLFMMFDTAFAANTVKEASPQIVNKLEELTGNKYTLEISVEDEKKEETPVDDDERVELVKRVFRGEIVEEE